MAIPSFWDDTNHAQKIIQEANDLKSWTEPLDDLLRRIDAVLALAAEPEIDPDFIQHRKNPHRPRNKAYAFRRNG
jgi:hypothetical protein